MKIEKNSEGNGFVLTNSAGDSLNVSFLDFWDIVRAGTEIDTKNEVIEYLSQCSDISGHDLDRIRAFPRLVDKITEQVIEDRINDESGDQIYYAAEKCIKEHLSTLDSLNMMKWFELSDDKCISVWYTPDKYDGDQFQMHLEEKCEDGSMGNNCEIISNESYATADISFEALCETLSEICDDADIFADDESAKSNLVSTIAKNIFHEFGMVDLNKEVKSGPIHEDFKEDLPEYCYGTVPSTGELIIISRGKPGYTPASSSTTDRDENERLAEKFNANLGVSKAQAEAMFVGSLFGWHVPGANPANYDDNGQFLHSEAKVSLSAQISAAQAKKDEIKPSNENNDIEHEI